MQQMIQERKVKGFEMAKHEKPIYKDGVWLVRSQSNPPLKVMGLRGEALITIYISASVSASVFVSESA